jgi:hypothetical protein
MEDAVFGKIEWSSDAWHRSLDVPFFSGFGKSVDEGDNEGEERNEGVRRGTSGNLSLPVEIDTNEVPKRPSRPQRDAFARMMNRRDRVWIEVMDALMAEYQRQRPKRLRYWKMLYGRRGINKSLPSVKDPAGLKPLVMPAGLYVKAATGEEAIVDIDLLFALAWFSEGAFVTIRDARAVEVSGLPSWLSHSWPERISHPIFGLLRRPERGPSWLGTAGAGPFAEWAAISVNRTTWDENASERTPGSNLDWPIARGDCFVRVHVKGDKGPSTRQATAFEAFKKSENVEGKAIRQALFDYYQANLKASKSAYRGPNVQRAVPKIENADDLSDITELYLLHVFPDQGEHPLAIGLIFRGAWTGQVGIGIRWREGRIEEIGKSVVATPQSR